MIRRPCDVETMLSLADFNTISSVNIASAQISADAMLFSHSVLLFCIVDIAFDELIGLCDVILY